MELKEGEKVTFNNRMYDFGYYSQMPGYVVLYEEGERNTQNSFAVKDIEVCLKKISSEQDDNQRQLDDWDPDKAKVVGTLKAPIEFKAETAVVKIDVDFGTPKDAKIVNKKAKIVDVGKRNKNSLF